MTRRVEIGHIVIREIAPELYEIRSGLDPEGIDGYRLLSPELLDLRDALNVLYDAGYLGESARRVSPQA